MVAGTAGKLQVSLSQTSHAHVKYSPSKQNATLSFTNDQAFGLSKHETMWLGVGVCPACGAGVAQPFESPVGYRFHGTTNASIQVKSRQPPRHIRYQQASTPEDTMKAPLHLPQWLVRDRRRLHSRRQLARDMRT